MLCSKKNFFLNMNVKMLLLVMTIIPELLNKANYILKVLSYFLFIIVN